MKVLPYYLAIGMPSNEFWYGDPNLVTAYRESHELWREQKNQEMWVQGIYNFQAFKSVIEAFGRALNGGKGSKPSEYPNEPIPFTKREKAASEERKKQHALEWIDEN